MTDGVRPIIIKRRSSAAIEGHHGGAWKVAYADFVTAMMAFFLLMWLLGATNETQRKGIADYFNPTVPVNKVSGGGEGAFGGETVYTDETLTQQGSGGSLLPNVAAEDEVSAPPPEDEVLERVAADLLGRGGESMVSQIMRRHVISKLTDEGLIVEVFSLPDDLLFEDTGLPSAMLRDILAAVSEAFATVENEIAVHAHVPSRPIVSVQGRGWRESALRAELVRGYLEGDSLDRNRFVRVSGFADSRPATSHPFSVRNDRLELILLRHEL